MSNLKERLQWGGRLEYVLELVSPFPYIPMKVLLAKSMKVYAGQVYTLLKLHELV